MNPELTAELRAAVARSGFTLTAVVREMGDDWGYSHVSKVLNDERTVPDGLETAFVSALQRLVDAEAVRLRNEAEARIQRLLASVPGAPEQAVA